MSADRLSLLGQAQRDRLAHIELRLWFVGLIRRQDLTLRFGIQTAAATRDLTLYRALAPSNIRYDSRSKTYVIGDGFQPLFDHSPERVLTWLAEGFGDGEPVHSPAGVVCALPGRPGQPPLATLSCVTRAISQPCPLRIRYHSIRSGPGVREIVPFALLDTGLRWHVRGFDRKSGEFRDFVLTRIQKPEVLGGAAIAPHERADQDIQWTRIVELELIPHPDQPHPEVTRMDHGLQDGVLRLKLRAAMAGYVLRQWNVDCSADHRLRGPEFRLWLSDPLALYGVESATLAPGYRPPEPGGRSARGGATTSVSGL